METSIEIKTEISKHITEKTARIIISNPVEKGQKYSRVEIKPTTVKGKKSYQIASYTDKQAFFSNVDYLLLGGKICELFGVSFNQINIFNEDSEVSLRISKKGRLLKNINSKNKATIEETSHNREKNYIIKSGVAIPPLVDIGVFTKGGAVVAKKYDKYKQINRFVEMIDDVLKNYNKKEIHIIDFGCGKSYLTFILYHYLTEIKKFKAYITGLDLKADVIDKCNETAAKYGYERLVFKLGDINGYKTDEAVDMVITLHACDTATDYALYNAISWGATYILSVPCCQHELNAQMSDKALACMTKYGIIKERMAALATDAIRGCMLEYRGYKTQLMEFVDFAHSPKNILIRAVKSNISKDKREASYREAKELCESLNVVPTIVTLCGE